MQFLKNLASIFHRLVICALLSAIFWGWVFGLVTQVQPAEKVSLYVYCPKLEDEALSIRLEEHRPEGIKAVEVHSFEYAIFGTDIVGADLYLLPESQLSNFPDAFCGEEISMDLPSLMTGDGAVVYRVYDGGTRTGIATEYITYFDDSTPPEDYYLAFGLNSAHLEDGAAMAVVEQLLQIP